MSLIQQIHPHCRILLWLVFQSLKIRVWMGNEELRMVNGGLRMVNGKERMINGQIPAKSIPV